MKTCDNAINSYDENGLTPLMRAVKAMDVDAVRQLIARGADLSLKGGNFGTSTALNIATLSLKRAKDSDTKIIYQKIINMLRGNMESTDTSKEESFSEDEVFNKMILKQGELFLLDGGSGIIGGYGILQLTNSNFTFSPKSPFDGRVALCGTIIPLDKIISANATTEPGLNGYLEIIYYEGRLKFTKGISGIKFFPFGGQIDPVFSEWARAITSATIQFKNQK